MSLLKVEDLQYPEKPQQAKSIKNASSGFSFSIFGKQLSDTKKEHFFSELHLLLAAGTDIKTGLELLEAEITKKDDHRLFQKIRDSVINGQSLSESLRQTRKFTAYDYHSLQIGEESGKMEQVLKDLAQYYESKQKQRRQLVSSLSYPGLVFLTAFGAVFFMLNFMVPMFADVFERFGNDLPVLTKTILAFSDFISETYAYMFLSIFLLVMFFVSQAKKPWFRDISTKIVHQIPFLGDFVKKIFLARFCHAMSLLIGAKISLPRALSLVREMVAYYPIERSLNTIEENLVHGTPLYRCMDEFLIYNKRMIALIKIGEEVNELESIFKKLGNQYTTEVEHNSQLMGSFLEPILIIFLGLVVGIILIAMYLPMFQLGMQIA